LAELAASGFRCRICNAGRDAAQLEVHHRTYEWLGCEEVGDLTTLCSQCHHTATDDLRRRRYAGRALSTFDHQTCSEDFGGFGELLLKGGRP
jgi:formate-dependent nitrite reductase cytochrome c552 subunit